MTDTQNSWTETDTQLYQDIAPVAVPARAEQIATLLALLPFNQNDTFRAVDIGSGEGFLSATLLHCFPQARVTALDGSEGMRRQTAKRLTPYGERFSVAPFDLHETGWYTHLENADGVLSSLVIHHLDDSGKRNLFNAIHTRLSARGTLLIADLIEAQRPEAKAYFAATWDDITKAQSIAHAGSAELFEKFEQSEWNYYRYYDPFDKPSPLFNQLLWLKEAGFAVVDCFWLQAGHAIYGGYKSGAATPANGLPFEAALRAAQEALS